MMAAFTYVVFSHPSDVLLSTALVFAASRKRRQQCTRPKIIVQSIHYHLMGHSVCVENALRQSFY